MTGNLRERTKMRVRMEIESRGRDDPRYEGAPQSRCGM